LAIFFAFVAVYTLSRHVIDNSSTTTTSTTTTSVATSTSTTTAAPAGTTCAAADFSGVYNEGEGAAGTIYASVTLTKTTPGTCTLKGWPLMTLQDRLGSVLPSTLVDVPTGASGFQFLTAKANAAPTVLTLGQNQSTTYSLAYSDVQSGATACDDAVTLNVQFVAGAAAIDVTPPYAVQPCDNGRIWVSPFY
jgi:hypothetical protein